MGKIILVGSASWEKDIEMKDDGEINRKLIGQDKELGIYSMC